MVSPTGDPIQHGSTLYLFPGVPSAGNGYRATKVRSNLGKSIKSQTL